MTGEFFGLVAMFSVVDASLELEDTLDAVDDLVEIPLEGSCGVFKHGECRSLVCPCVLPNP